MKYKGIIFDFDGVITDGIPFHDEAYVKVFKTVELNIPLELLHTKIGMTPKEVITGICRDFKLRASTNALTDMHHRILFDLYSKKAKPSPHLKALILQFSHMNALIGVASSTNSDILKHVLKKFNIQQYFSAIVGGEEIQKGKPNPEMITRALEKLDIKATDSIAIDDARSGIIAAKSINMYTIAYLHYSKTPIPESDMSLNDFNKLDVSAL
jgi:HAD superfamily hydrolase (TIGR01509 family)